MRWRAGQRERPRRLSSGADHQNARLDRAVPSGWTRFRVAGVVGCCHGRLQARHEQPWTGKGSGADQASRSGQLVCRQRPRGLTRDTAARTSSWSTRRSIATAVLLRRASCATFSKPADARAKPVAMKKSRPARFTRFSSVRVEIGGFTRAQLIENEASDKNTTKPATGKTSVDPLRLPDSRTTITINRMPRINFVARAAKPLNMFIDLQAECR